MVNIKRNYEIICAHYIKYFFDLLVPGLPFLASIYFVIPIALGQTNNQVLEFYLNWALDIIIIQMGLRLIGPSWSRYLSLGMSTLLGCCISIYAIAFHDFFTPLVLFQNWGSATKLPGNVVLFFFPYAATFAGLGCLGYFYFQARPNQKFSLRKLCMPVGAKIILVLIILSTRPMPIEFLANERVMRCYGYLGVVVQDVIRYTIAARDSNLLEKCLADSKAIPIEKLETSFRTRNVVVIQVESFDSIILSEKINGEFIAPNLQSLSKKVGVLNLETHHLGVSGSIGTDFQFLTGFRQPGIINAFQYHLNLLAAYGLPVFCQQNGISFELFHGNDPSFWRRNTGLHELGLANWHSSYNVQSLETSKWGTADSDMVNAFIKCIRFDKMSSHLYYWITLSNHVPFDLVNYHHFPGKSAEVKVGNAFNYTDGQVKRLIDSWPYDNTAFIIFGDHLAPLPGRTSAYVPAIIFFTKNKQIRPMTFLNKPPSVIEVPAIHFLVKSMLGS